MAKKIKVKVEEEVVENTTVNEELLTMLVHETRKNGFVHINNLELSALENLGYAEVNNSKETEAGFAWRATEKGIKYIMGSETKTKVESVKHVFAIGAFNPENVIAKAKGTRGRTSKYDFDSLVEVNTFMFVPATEKVPNPHISLASTVLNHNAKYAVPSGETREVSRKPKGGTEKVTKFVPIMNYTKEFAVYPYTQEGVYGAAIVRIK